MNSVWIVEYRHRARKNGKWSEWVSRDHSCGPVSGYTTYPAHQVFAHDKYEKRVVEYVRKEPEVLDEPTND